MNVLTGACKSHTVDNIALLERTAHNRLASTTMKNVAVNVFMELIDTLGRGGEQALFIQVVRPAPKGTVNVHYVAHQRVISDYCLGFAYHEARYCGADRFRSILHHT